MWIVFAVLAAICFGFRGILYHWSSKKPMNRNLMLCGVFSTGAILSFGWMIIFGHSFSAGSYVGIMMGLFSFAANTSMYRGFAVGKASMVAILTGLPAVVVALFAFFLWGESLNLWQFLAFTVILSGIILMRYSNDLSFKGIHWGCLAMLFFGLNDLSGKLSMRLQAEMFPTLGMMFSTGALLFCGLWLLDMRKSIVNLRNPSSLEVAAALDSENTTDHAPCEQTDEEKMAPRMWSKMKTYGWGMLVGFTNSFGMAFILPAFERGITGLVSAVVALNILMILLYTRVFIKEKFTKHELAGICVSFIGIVILSFVKT